MAASSSTQPEPYFIQIHNTSEEDEEDDDDIEPSGEKESPDDFVTPMCSESEGKYIPFDSFIAQNIWAKIAVEGNPSNCILFITDPFTFQCPLEPHLYKLLKPRTAEIMEEVAKLRAERPELTYPFILNAHTIARKLKIPSHGKSATSYRGCEYYLRKYFAIPPGKQLTFSLENLHFIFQRLKDDEAFMKAIDDEFNSIVSVKVIISTPIEPATDGDKSDIDFVKSEIKVET
jgi:hypothetical protein